MSSSPLSSPGSGTSWTQTPVQCCCTTPGDRRARRPAPSERGGRDRRPGHPRAIFQRAIERGNVTVAESTMRGRSHLTMPPSPPLPPYPTLSLPPPRPPPPPLLLPPPPPPLSPPSPTPPPPPPPCPLLPLPPPPEADAARPAGADRVDRPRRTPAGLRARDRARLRNDPSAAPRGRLRAGDPLAETARRALDLSRLDSHAIAVDPRPIVLRRALAHIIEQADVGVDITIDVPDDLAVVVDPLVLDRVVSNLVINAARYGAPGRDPRRGRATRQAPSHHRRGRRPGCDRRGPTRLFERFARGSSATGSGLGLAIARSYARAHGGDLIFSPLVREAPASSSCC